MACGKYDIIREGEEIILRVDCEDCPFFPSLEDEPRLMALTVDILAEAGTVTQIVFVQKRDIEYDEAQASLLSEIASVYKHLVGQKFAFGMLAKPACARWVNPRYARVQDILYRLLKSDPVSAYVELKRLLREEKRQVDEGIVPPEGVQCLQNYYKLLQDTVGLLEKTKIMVLAQPFLPGFQIGDRTIYRRLLSPTIKPDFMFTKLMASFPPEGEELATYQVGDSEITVFQMPESVQYLYHMVPSEFNLSEDKYSLLDAARKIMAEHQPKRSEFVDPERMRQVFTAVGSDLLEELASHRGMHLRQKERDELAKILVRYTVGFGLVEVLLEDEKVQDITINSPMGRIPIFLVHNEFGDCTTNIIPTAPEGESWASKLRMISGRPLDEANPILDTELVLPGARARVAAITSPLNPTGLAYSIRRHRDKPWTLPLFMKNKMLNALAAGTLSFLIDGSRTMLVAGTRSSGKTSLLGSVMVDIMRRSRIITIEDTLELPVDALRKLNYNIQSMKVASALTRGTTEVSADEGIRTTLRLGDSSLIVGEVRSVEARALYEAMRVGALANVVAGTIHGDSPYGVFDRVVNDLGVPRTSFKATDLIVVANPVRSPDGIHRWRRVTQITEVRKLWEEDPLTEGGFVDLFKYDPQTDSLQPTNDLLRGDSDVIKAVAGSVKEWAGNWDAVWDNINLRAKIKQALVDFANKLDKPELLEADFYVRANDEFHRISDQVREEVGALDSERIFFAWNEWLKRAVKK
ncbi:type II/IV secretion system ATPase subunit [Candidatus Woesearchaeota archaeon]|nr:type II/IV secretion system ATPase subunit [Candidatus Woesearchaeota archaeon]MBW3016436.1 type II/IV secretion system ATPase subunit [Candidatus Woesearchaeota archaeon]